MKEELPRWISTSPCVLLFLPITTRDCLTEYSNSLPWILAMGLLLTYSPPPGGTIFSGLWRPDPSLRASRAQASACVSYLTLWDTALAAMLVLLAVDAALGPAPTGVVLWWVPPPGGSPRSPHVTRGAAARSAIWPHCRH